MLMLLSIPEAVSEVLTPSLLLGYKTRFGAIALVIFLIPATLIFHTSLADPIQQIMFLKNLGLLGGLLLVMQYGLGRISLDRTP